MIRRSTFALLLFAAAPLAAAEADGTIRLSPEEIARLDAEAEARARAAPDDDAEPKRRVHGEVEMSVGTGGSYGVGGAVGLPLGEHGAAALYGHSERYPRRPGRRNLDRR